MAELNYKDFPDDLHLHLKIQAVHKGQTMRAYVLELLEKGSGFEKTKKKAGSK